MTASRKKKNNKTSGFTLIETLVSLAIVSVTLVIVFEGISLTSTSYAKIKNNLTATLTAESLVERLGNDIPLTAGSVSGVSRLGFPWQIEITEVNETSSHQISKTPKLYEVTVRVSLNGKEDEKEIVFQSTKLDNTL